MNTRIQTTQLLKIFVLLCGFVLFLVLCLLVSLQMQIELRLVDVARETAGGHKSYTCVRVHLYDIIIRGFYNSISRSPNTHLLACLLHLPDNSLKLAQYMYINVGIAVFLAAWMRDYKPRTQPRTPTSHRVRWW